MKKIMLAAAIVCAAAMARAAAVSWKLGTKIYDNTGAQLKGNGAVTAYVYQLASESAYTDLTDIWGTYGADVQAGGKGATNKGSTSQYVANITVKAPTDSVANTTYYAAVITTYKVGDDTYYYAEKGYITTGDDGNASPKFADALSTAAGATGA